MLPTMIRNHPHQIHTESHEQYEDAPVLYPTAEEAFRETEEHGKEPSSSCLTMLIDDPLKEIVTKSLEKMNVTEYVIEGLMK